MQINDRNRNRNLTFWHFSNLKSPTSWSKKAYLFLKILPFLLIGLIFMFLLWLYTLTVFLWSRKSLSTVISFQPLVHAYRKKIRIKTVFAGNLSIMYKIESENDLKTVWKEYDVSDCFTNKKEEGHSNGFE